MAGVVLALVACQTHEPAQPAKTADLQQPEPAPQPAAQPAEPAKPAPVPKSKPPAPMTEEQRVALGANESRPLTTGNVIGLELEEVRRLLGEPTLKLDEPPARIWQYQTASCTLRLTFFPEVKTQRYRTLSVQLGNSDEDTEDAKSRCLNAVRADVLRS